MKRRSSKPQRKKQRIVAKRKPAPPESELRIKARQHAEKSYPIDDFVLVAEIAARLASGRPKVTVDNALTLGREAIFLLDGVRKALEEQAERRARVLASANESEEFPEHLSWHAGKKFILGTDNQASDDQFRSMVKDKMRRHKFQAEADRLAKLHSGGEWAEPSIGIIPATTQEEYKEVEMHYRKNGFSSWELRSLRDFFHGWRLGNDKRRKKTFGATAESKFPLGTKERPLTVP